MRNELTPEQIKYLNGTALQQLMQLDPEFKMENKRAIYARTVDALAMHFVEEYWEVKSRGKGN